MMEEGLFWNLIEAAKTEADGECEEQTVILMKKLQTLPVEDIIAFFKQYVRLSQLAYRHDLRAAAYMMNGSGSDDGFTDFRAWLIAQGKEVFYNALKNPETLVSIDLKPGEDAECEQFGYVALDAYEAKTGEQMPVPKQPASAIQGNQWEWTDLQKRFPKLWTKFYK